MLSRSCLVAQVDPITAQIVLSRSKRSSGHGSFVGLVILYLLELPTRNQTDLSQAQTRGSERRESQAPIAFREVSGACRYV